MISGSILSLSSISRTLGATTSVAKRLTDSLSISSSSVNVSNEFSVEPSMERADTENALELPEIMDKLAPVGAVSTLEAHLPLSEANGRILGDETERAAERSMVETTM